MIFSDHISKETIQKAIEFWSPKYGYILSEDEARDIIQNLYNYFNTLAEIDASILKKTQEKKK